MPRQYTKHATATPDGGWGWIVVFGSFSLHVLADGICYAFGIFTPEIVEYYDSTRQVVGWLNSVRVGISLVIGPLASKSIQVHGFRLTTMFGSLLATIGLGATYFWSNYFFLFVTTAFLGGFGYGLLFLPSICIVSTYFEKKRSFAVGLSVCGSGFGTFLFGPFVRHLVDLYTWRGAMLILAGVMLNCCVCAALYKPVQNTSINASNAEDQGKSPTSNRVIFHHKEAEYKYPTLHQRDRISRVGVRELDRLQQRSPMPPAPLSTSSSTSVGAFSNPAVTVALYSYLLRNSLPSSQTPVQSIDNQSNVEEATKSRLFAQDEEISHNGFRHSLVQILNPYLLKHSIFMLFAMSNFLTSMGFNAPFLFAVDRAMLMGIEAKMASLLISSIGIGNTLGRVIFGALATCGGKTFHISLYGTALSICGCITAASCFAVRFPWMITYTMGFGFFSGTFVSLTPVVLVDLLGFECLNDSFGLTFLFMGIAVFVGPPLAGWIFDYFLSYDIAFFICGAVIFVSGAMMLPVICIDVTPPKKPLH